MNLFNQFTRFLFLATALMSVQGGVYVFGAAEVYAQSGHGLDELGDSARYRAYLLRQVAEYNKLMNLAAIRDLSRAEQISLDSLKGKIDWIRDHLQQIESGIDKQYFIHSTRPRLKKGDKAVAETLRKIENYFSSEIDLKPTSSVPMKPVNGALADVILSSKFKDYVRTELSVDRVEDARIAIVEAKNTVLNSLGQTNKRGITGPVQRAAKLLLRFPLAARVLGSVSAVAPAIAYVDKVNAYSSENNIHDSIFSEGLTSDSKGDAVPMSETPLDH